MYLLDLKLYIYNIYIIAQVYTLVNMIKDKKSPSTNKCCLVVFSVVLYFYINLGRKNMNNQNNNKSSVTIILILAVIILLISIIPAALYDGKKLPGELTSMLPIIVVFVVIGIALIIIGIIKILYTKKHCTHRVLATCIDIGKYDSYDSESDSYTTMYSPIFEFHHDGETFRVTNSFYSSNCNVEVGEQVELLFNPAKPKEFVYSNGQDGVHGTLIISGIIFIVMGIVCGIAFSN